MSYPKHFLVWRALDSLRGHYSSNQHAYLITFVVFIAKKNNLSCDLSIREVIDNASFNSFPKEDLLLALEQSGGFCNDTTLISFEKIEVEDIVSFLSDKDNLENSRSDIGQFSQSEGLNDLVCRIFNFNKNDSLLDLGSGIASFLNYSFCNYDLKIVEGVEIDKLAFVYGNIFAEIRNANIKVFNADAIKYDFGKLYSKIFSVPPFGYNINKNFDIDKIEYVSKIFGDSITTTRIEIPFILKIMQLLEPTGTAIVCVPQGFLFSRDSSSYLTRQYLVNNNFLESVIDLPVGTFSPYTSVKTSLLVLNKKKNKKETVKMINATSICSDTRRGGKGLFSEDVNTIYETFLSCNEESSSFRKLVEIDEIKKQDYRLETNIYLLETKIILPGVKDYKRLSSLLTFKIARGAMLKASELDELETTDPTNYFYLTVRNIQDNKIEDNLLCIKYIDEKNKNNILKNGDLVLGMVISDSIKVAIVEDLKEEKILPANNLYIIRVNKEILNPIYLKMILELPDTNKLFKSFASSSSLPSISVDFLNDLFIPLPSMQIQNELANEYLQIEQEQRILKQQIVELNTKKESLVSTCKYLYYKNLEIEK